MSTTPRPVALVILDGWGYTEDTEYNAIRAARTPVWDRLWREYPQTLVRTSGAAVGLPSEQMGNSEVGHMNLGAGRVVYQEFTRISRSIRTGSFFTNQTLVAAVEQAKESGGALHILGLLSPGGVHSHEEHIYAMVELAVQRGMEEIYVHAFLDGRDTPPKSAEQSVVGMERKFAELGHGRIASMIGRYFAMDRDHRWPRIEKSYNLITQGLAEYHAPTALEGLAMAYGRGETDEFLEATAIVPEGGEAVRMQDGDAVVFMNFRSDRARQVTRAFISDDFDGFKRKHEPRLSSFTSLTEYNAEFDIPVAFPPERLKNGFGEYLSNLGLHQLRLAETEKYAHVTFFFNGGIEQPFEGEDRILVPSPQVATYDLQPEMSAQEVTDHFVEAIGSGKYDAIIVNYANSDMVGHTGNFQAAVTAIEAVDFCLGRVLKALHAAGGEMLITADHGNAEQMLDPNTGQAQTAHTTNPVPLIYVGRSGTLLPNGALCDIAPTLLRMMNLERPPEMSGRSLLQLES